MNISRFTAADIDAVLKLERECFCSEAWSRREFEELAAEPEDGAFITLSAMEDGELCGYICASAVMDEAEIASAAASPKRRRQGIARELIRKFEDLAMPKTVFLEVRASNTAAKALYESLGFYEYAIRRRYYDSPLEDALLMRKDCEK